MASTHSDGAGADLSVMPHFSPTEPARLDATSAAIAEMRAVFAEQAAVLADELDRLGRVAETLFPFPRETREREAVA